MAATDPKRRFGLLTGDGVEHTLLTVVVDDLDNELWSQNDGQHKTNTPYCPLSRRSGLVGQPGRKYRKSG